jgi:hypothetical protein
MLKNYEELMVLQGLFLPLNPVVSIIAKRYPIQLLKVMVAMIRFKGWKP